MKKNRNNAVREPEGRTPANRSARRAALGGLFTALALIFSWLEWLFPFPIPIPGIKLGLANAVTLCALWWLGAPAAAALTAARILLSGLLFSGPVATLYALGGFAVSFPVMFFLKRSGKFRTVTVSIAGGTAHNLGQLAVAAFAMKTASVFWFLPALTAGGILAGAVIGAIGELLIPALKGRFPGGKP